MLIGCKVGHIRKTNFNYIYAVMSSKLAIIIQNRDCPCAFFVKNRSVLAVVKKTPNVMLGTIMKGVENKPENLIMLCINPWCVYIFNIEYNLVLTLNSRKKRSCREGKWRWSTAQVSPCEEIKQAGAEKKCLRGYKSVDHKIKVRTQKWLKTIHLLFLITQTLKGTQWDYQVAV